MTILSDDKWVNKEVITQIYWENNCRHKESAFFNTLNEILDVMEYLVSGMV